VNDIQADLTSANWWFSTVFVALIVGVIASVISYSLTSGRDPSVYPQNRRLDGLIRFVDVVTAIVALVSLLAVCRVSVVRLDSYNRWMSDSLGQEDIFDILKFVGYGLILAASTARLCAFSRVAAVGHMTSIAALFAINGNTYSEFFFRIGKPSLADEILQNFLFYSIVSLITNGGVVFFLNSIDVYRRGDEEK
jgi:hypothetical protein